MLTKLEASAKEAWGGSHSAIDATGSMNARNYWFVTASLAGTGKTSNNGKTKRIALPETGDITLFCQVMMDYISAGHFEVYEQIVKACKVNGQRFPSPCHQRLYPRIDETTDTALTFNDKYADHKTIAKKMPDQVTGRVSLPVSIIDLSQMGQALEERFGLGR